MVVVESGLFAKLGDSSSKLGPAEGVLERGDSFSEESVGDPSFVRSVRVTASEMARKPPKPARAAGLENQSAWMACLFDTARGEVPLPSSFVTVGDGPSAVVAL